ncbi:monomeric [FeFe] hydrogenase [Desulfohalobiaceae bacterium Ax17]|uniref:monomeric [FeFe] hydrogenase n=1 Tax=Desulfovulcanus ferrireducens TaxID=2831190 RepID=UPI00207BCA34|nr:monomeric [FeFe] hydrogenase [Desulfovulcanus ferrireducens]MBT8762979.1 monomeric [FeFe] hydrogenase [Desulfovulcanus ferrireducens]
MNYVNNATLIRRKLLIRIASLFFKNELKKNIDRVPLEIAPKNSKSIRCCIYKDRAVLKYRIMALLGFGMEDEKDELTPLSDYVKKALLREKPESPVLTVIDMTCRSCVRSNYFVTNACRSCVARPCLINCRKNAITMVDGKAKIDSETCVNCGICMKVCPYHAIIYIPIPCEETCPVGAIKKGEDGKEKIDHEKCIYCGKCLQACPFGAILEKSQLIDVMRPLKTANQKTVAIVAPSIVGQFSTDFEKIVSALRKLGFDYIVEVAAGADIAAQKEAEEFIERMEKSDKFMTSSCCPAYTEVVKKHLPVLAPYVSNTETPMHYAAELARNTYPNAKIVFVGPCVAKRQEAIKDPVVDYVLTFEELGALFVAREIEVPDCKPDQVDISANKMGRGFPVTGGVTRAIQQFIGKDTALKEVIIDGLSKQNLRILKKNAQGNCPGNFIEVMCCEGGCVAGPGVLSNPQVAARKVKQFIGE